VDAVDCLADLRSYGINRERTESVVLVTEIEQTENIINLQERGLMGCRIFPFLPDLVWREFR